MKKFNPIRGLFFCALLVLGITGCATGNVNPSTARPNTGYVDFQADSSDTLSWQVARQDEDSQNFNVIYSELSPPANGLLRLAFAPGHYPLRVTFLNRVVIGPGFVEVAVVDGKITPVQVTLTPVGTIAVQRKEQRVGTTVKGYAGHKTKLINDESVTYQVSAVATGLLPYQQSIRQP